VTSGISTGVKTLYQDLKFEGTLAPGWRREQKKAETTDHSNENLNNA